MRIYVKTLAVLLTSLAAPAVAEFVTVAEVYEVDLKDIQLPAATTGSLIFVSCEGCDPRRIRVTPETRYIADNKDYSLSDYRKLLAGITDRDEPTVAVKHHLASDTIVSIRVSL